MAEMSKPSANTGRGAVAWEEGKSSVSVGGKAFGYPYAIIGPTIDQEGTFDHCDFAVLIEDFLDGFDVNVLAYGQTGTGKTHTMLGPPELMKRAGAGELGIELTEDYGMVPRTLFTLIDRVAQLNSQGDGYTYVLNANAVELASWYPSDLLYGKNSCFLDRSARPMHLFGQTNLRLETREHALKLFGALATRSTRSTRLNDSSSRSHCFITLKLLQCDPENHVRTSRFQFVDMCGSERLNDAHKDGNIRQLYRPSGAAEPSKEMTSLMEGFSANYSLMQLSSCIREVVRVQDTKKKVSFRLFMVDLVMLLQSSLQGTSRTAVFVNLSQHPEHIPYSVNGLDFGFMCSKLRQRCKRNPSQSFTKMKAEAQKSYDEAETALSRSVKGSYYEKRLAQSRHAQETLSMLRYLQTHKVERGGSSSNPLATDAFIDPFAFHPPTTAFSYTLAGLIDASSAWEVRYMEGIDWAKEMEKPIAEERKEMAEWFKQQASAKVNRSYRDRQHVTECVVDAREHGSDNPALRILIHTDGRPNEPVEPVAAQSSSSSETARPAPPALVYFHGGGCVVGTADDYSRIGLAGRYAIDNRVTVFNVDYRLAPESKVPTQIQDGAAAIRYVSRHAGDLRVDPARIAVAGDSGGAYVAVGACMLLANAGEGSLVKLLVPIAPQTGAFLRRTSEDELRTVCPQLRLDMDKMIIAKIEKRLVPGGKVTAKWAQDPRLYPNLMLDDVAAHMPRTVVMTSEFDVFRPNAHELAKKLHQHGRLLDLCIHPGTTHCWHLDFSHSASALFWKDSMTIFKTWL